LPEAIDCVAQFVAQGTPHQIATVNPEFVMMAQDNLGFRDVLNTAALCVPDGIGLIWASRFLGDPLRERVAGVELTEQIAARAARAGWRVFLLGAALGVAGKTAAILQDRYPGLVIAGTYSGSPAMQENDAIVELVRQGQADVLFVAFGAPAQDLWIARNLEQLNVKVALGVGGSFDFISGVAQRAPRWVQRLGLEWLHRLVRQPWRIKRQLALPRFVFLILGCRWRTGH
jgi:N-acetylglucosaminyldiphosphoundecaprenol N-acetyl-beta-D-mannosaminyltransferase